MDIEELKSILRVSGNALDAALAAYQLAAETYLANAGVAKDYNNGLYKTVVTVFCGTLLENPTLLSVQGGVDSIGITFNAIVAQLRLSQVTAP